MFHIPVALFVFKRKDTLSRIVDRLRQIKPQKVYIIADGPRNDEEAKQTQEVRSLLEKLIDWDCDVVKNYAESNRGVYENIGLGAKWVLEREESAIFLEDDNLPALSFFDFCKEMLGKYKLDQRILWVCGTNYLKEYKPSDGSSYMFTRHLLPCGWASWSDKFLKFYDGELELFDDINIRNMRENYNSQQLFEQDIDVIAKTKRFLLNDKRKSSWDRQMAFSLRLHGLYGISPSNNQIMNIGVDEHSTHGGNSMKKTMTRRFCEIDDIEMEFPLKHPRVVVSDYFYEKKVEGIILYPFSTRAMMKAFKLIKPFLGLRKDESFVLKLREWKSKISSKLG